MKTFDDLDVWCKRVGAVSFSIPNIIENRFYVKVDDTGLYKNYSTGRCYTKAMISLKKCLTNGFVIWR